MSKIVLVETVSMFRHVYAVELPDDAPTEWALDDVVSEIGKDSPTMEEIGQESIAENILSHRVVDEKEYLQVFDNMSSYLSGWSPEEKKRFIYVSPSVKESA